MSRRMEGTRLSTLAAVGALLAAACQESTTPAPTPASVMVTPAVDTLFFRGDTVRLTAATQDAAGTPIPDAAVAWAASPPLSFASVESLGTDTGTVAGLRLSQTAAGASVLLYPRADGIGRIQVSAGAASITLVVNVRQKVVGLMIHPDPMALAAGEWARFSVTAADSRGGPWDLSPDELALASSDSTVAIAVLADSDTEDCYGCLFVVGRHPGTGTITASLTTVDGTFTSAASVTVHEPP